VNLDWVVGWYVGDLLFHVCVEICLKIEGHLLLTLQELRPQVLQKMLLHVVNAVPPAVPVEYPKHRHLDIKRWVADVHALVDEVDILHERPRPDVLVGADVEATDIEVEGPDLDHLADVDAVLHDDLSEDADGVREGVVHDPITTIVILDDPTYQLLEQPLLPRLLLPLFRPLLLFQIDI